MKRIALTALVSGLAIAAATPASAAVIIGISVNGGAITQVATDGGTGSANYNTTTGGYYYNVNGTGFPIFTNPQLNTQSLNVQQAGGANSTIDVFVTQTDVTSFNGTLMSAFTSNVLPGVTATITSYRGANTATPFGVSEATFLAGQTQLFSASYPPSSGLVTGYNTFNSAGPFSETVLYHLTFTGGAGSNFNGTANLAAAVPETATWGMMLLGFGLFGAALRRRSVGARIRFA